MRKTPEEFKAMMEEELHQEQMLTEAYESGQWNPFSGPKTTVEGARSLADKLLEAMNPRDKRAEHWLSDLLESCLFELHLREITTSSGVKLVWQSVPSRWGIHPVKEKEAKQWLRENRLDVFNANGGVNSTKLRGALWKRWKKQLPNPDDLFLFDIEPRFRVISKKAATE